MISRAFPILLTEAFGWPGKCSCASAMLKIDRKDFLPERPLRRLPEGGLMFEITIRCLQGRLLLRPSKKMKEIVLGILGLALVRYPTVQLHGYWFLSNHFNLLATFPDARVMAAFMCFVNSNIAREAGRLHGWREKIFGRPYRAIPVLDEKAQIGRLRYLLAQGTKEGLVAAPSEWPGAKCLDALMTGVPDVGWWFDRSAEYRARRRGEKPAEYQYATQYPVPLSPLPCWRDATPDELAHEVGALVSEIVADSVARNRELKRRPMGVRKILSQHPHDHPLRPSRSPAPLCHASSKRRRREYRRWYWSFVDEYRSAAKEFRQGLPTAIDRFPPGCFIPSKGYRPYLRQRVAA